MLMVAAVIGLFPKSLKKEKMVKQKEIDGENCNQIEVKENGELKGDLLEEFRFYIMIWFFFIFFSLF